MSANNYSTNYGWYLLLLATLLGVMVIMSILALRYGSVTFSFTEVWQVLLPQSDDSVSPIVEKIIIDLRLPRVMFALMIGAGLALTGLLLQTLTQNSLADPFLFGLSSGAATGAIIAMVITGEIIGVWTLPVFAFCGSLMAVACVLFLLGSQSTRSQNLILAGLTTSFIFTAISNFVLFYGSHRSNSSFLFWSLGGLGLAKWQNLWIPASGLLLLAVFLARNHRKLDALLAGENTAVSLGINVNQLRYKGFIIASIATGCFVALTGVIGFIGLMVPHMSRALSGALHLPRLAMTGLLGGLLLLISDIVARALLAPQELPVGMITSAIGAFFMFVLLKRRY